MHRGAEASQSDASSRRLQCHRRRFGRIGEVLREHAAVSFVGLTGSTEVGKILYGRACIGLKKLGLELAPFVEY